ncbi:MAG: hypothetical protein AAGF45_01190 [Pseudomonadota bacterium]
MKRVALSALAALALSAADARAEPEIISSSERSWDVLSSEYPPIRHAALICHYPPQTDNYFCLAIGCRAAGQMEPYVLNVGGDPFPENAYAFTVDGTPIAAVRSTNVGQDDSHTHVGAIGPSAMDSLIDALSAGSKVIVTYNTFRVRFPLRGFSAALSEVKRACAG